MTDWSDAEISRRLALAIGWKEDQEDPDVVVFSEDYGRNSWCAVWFDSEWRTFDYRDPAVYAPIAERFNCFPTFGGSIWFAAVKKDIHPVNRIALQADTAAKAVALAVIKAKEQACAPCAGPGST